MTFDVARHWELGFDQYAIVAGLTGLAEIGLGAWLGRGQRDQEPDHISSRYVWPLRHIGLLLAGLAVGLCVESLLTLGTGAACRSTDPRGDRPGRRCDGLCHRVGCCLSGRVAGAT